MYLCIWRTESQDALRWVLGCTGTNRLLLPYLFLPSLPFSPHKPDYLGSSVQESVARWIQNAVVLLRADKKLSMRKYFYIIVSFMHMLSLILSIFLTSFHRLWITGTSVPLSSALCMPPFNMCNPCKSVFFFIKFLGLDKNVGNSARWYKTSFH